MKQLEIHALVLLMILQSGCSTTPPPTLGKELHAALGRVAILASTQSPELSFEGFFHSKGEGAAATGGGTFLACTSGLLQGGCAGAFCGAAAVVMLGICGIAGVVGAVTGAVVTPSAETVTAAENSMLTALTRATIQRSLRDQVRAAALTADVDLVPVEESSEQSAVAVGDFRTLLTDADTVLIVGLTEAGTTPTGGGSLSLQATAHVRLVRTGDNAELFDADYRFNGGSWSLEKWAENQGERLLAGLQDIYERLGAHIVDSAFRLYPFPDRVPHSAGFMALAFGLAPIDPPTRGQLTGDKLIGEMLEWTTVSSLRPELRWEPFPRKGDIEKAPDEMGRVRNVRYDLVIARERDLAPAEVVYRREGLPAPVHRLASALARDAHYFWTVRARFELYGRERVTEWSTTTAVAETGMTAPSRWSYRFKTP